MEENIKRAQNDDRSEYRIKFGIENSRHIYNQYDYPHLDITHITVDEAVEKLIDMIDIA